MGHMVVGLSQDIGQIEWTQSEVVDYWLVGT